MRPTTSCTGSQLLGIGCYRPRRVVSNGQISALVSHDDAWIRRRTGISSRRYADPDETIAQMAIRAAADALVAAAVAPEAVDMVLVASMSNLQQSPPIAAEIAYRLGAVAAAALDIDGACAGFSYGIGLADALVRAGSASHVVLVGVDRMTDIVAPTGTVAALFGDGAAAVVIGPHDSMGIGPTVWGADGSRRDLIAHSATWLDFRDHPELPWPTMQMSGREVFRWAIDNVPDVCRQAVKAAGLTLDEIDAFVAHQANLRIIESVALRLDLKPGTPVADDIVSSGNTSAASIGLALADLRDHGRLKSGGWALLVGFGAGLSYASQVVRAP